jgi:hypothetical protein
MESTTPLDKMEQEATCEHREIPTGRLDERVPTRNTSWCPSSPRAGDRRHPETLATANLHPPSLATPPTERAAGISCGREEGGGGASSPLLSGGLRWARPLRPGGGARRRGPLLRGSGWRSLQIRRRHGRI